MRGFPKFFRASLRAIEEAGWDPRLEACVGAVIVHGGAVVGTGVNRRVVNAYVNKPWLRRLRPHCASLHAEVDAIMRARRRTDLRGCRMYVSRMTKAREIANARPCDMCLEVLRRYGFVSVAWTTGLAWDELRLAPAPWSVRVRRSKLRASPSK